MNYISPDEYLPDKPIADELLSRWADCLDYYRQQGVTREDELDAYAVLRGFLRREDEA